MAAEEMTPKMSVERWNHMKKRSASKKGPPPTHDTEVTAAVRGCLKKAARPLQKAQLPNAKDIHNGRTKIKRARAFLQLLRPAFSDAEFRAEDRHLKEAARQLAPLRDSFMMSGLVEELIVDTRHRKKRRDLATVRENLIEKPGQESPASQRQATHEASAALNEGIHRLRGWPRISIDDPVVQKGLKRVYSSCRHRLQQVTEKGGERRMHRFRIRVKSLFYELQLLKPLCPKRVKEMVRQLDKLQEKLGDEHDLTVLGDTIQKAPAKADAQAPADRVQDLLEKRGLKLSRTCQRMGEKIFKKKPGRFVRRFFK